MVQVCCNRCSAHGIPTLPSFLGGNPLPKTHARGKLFVFRGRAQQTNTAATVTTAASDLLIIAIHAFRQGGMDYCANITFIDAQPKGGGSDHQVDIITKPL